MIGLVLGVCLIAVPLIAIGAFILWCPVTRGLLDGILEMFSNKWGG